MEEEIMNIISGSISFKHNNYSVTVETNTNNSKVTSYIISVYNDDNSYNLVERLFYKNDCISFINKLK